MQGEDTRERLGAASLYGILDLGYVEKTDLERVALGLLEGGAGVIQLRAKGYGAGGVLDVLETHAPRLGAICGAHGVPFIINDFPEVAVAVGADGVHIGQGDGTLEQVRKVTGGGMVVGRSTHSPEQAAEAMREGFDYIGYGPLFPTPTKEGRPGIGLAGVRGVQEAVGGSIPVFCIGGIKPDNLDLVLASGARRVVIVSALLRAANIPSTTRSVMEILNTENRRP